MTICSEKFAELEEQFRILKGRVVYQYRGDSAKDEEGAAAVYQSLSASPTSIRGMNAKPTGMSQGTKLPVPKLSRPLYKWF